MLGSITSCCSGNEPALLPRTTLGEEGRPDLRKWRKLSLVQCVICDISVAGDFLTFEKIIESMPSNVNENTFMKEHKEQ